MTVILCILMGIIGFLSGFLLAVLHTAERKPTKQKAMPRSEELERICREYSNFLNYDGTEQL